MGEDQDRHGFGSGPMCGAALHGTWGYDRRIPGVTQGATIYLRPRRETPKHGSAEAEGPDERRQGLQSRLSDRGGEPTADGSEPDV